MQTNLPNSTVAYHPRGTVEVEVYDRKGNKLEVLSVYMTFNTVVVRLESEVSKRNVEEQRSQ